MVVPAVDQLVAWDEGGMWVTIIIIYLSQRTDFYFSWLLKILSEFLTFKSNVYLL